MLNTKLLKKINDVIKLYFENKNMLSGCELIDAENISLPSKNMKLGDEQADIFSASIIFTFR